MSSHHDDVPITEEFVAFLKTLTDLELGFLLHDARQVDDKNSATAILQEFKARIDVDNQAKARANSVNVHDQARPSGQSKSRSSE